MKLQKFATEHLVVAWYRVQARIGITLAEARALLTLSALLLLGTTVQEIEKRVRTDEISQSPGVVFVSADSAHLSPDEQGAMHLAVGAQSGIQVAGDSGADSGENSAEKSTFGPSSDAPACVDLNSAASEQLQSLPGVGPAIAARIVDYRSRYGRFAAIEEITAVRGIGPRTLERIASKLCGSIPSP